MSSTPEPRGTLELRIHGVHGTLPSNMLGVQPSDVRQVAGDAKTGFFRAADGTIPYRKLDKADVAVEVYSWGSLTSGLAGILGWVRRALWLLLLPFALANLAYWARLNIDGTLRSRVGAKLTRLGALLLTVFMVLIPTIVADDLVAWQCYRGGSPGCTRLPGFLDFLANPDPGQRLVVASVLPLLFVGVLWMLSGQSLARYEALRPADVDRPSGEHDRLLQHGKLWDGAKRTRRLQRFHVAAALAVVALVPACNLVGRPGDDVGLVAAIAVLAVVAALAAFGVTLGHPDDIEMRDLTAKPWADAFATRLLGIAGLAVAATFGWMWLIPSRIDDTVDFDGHNLWFIGVFVLLTVVHLAIYTHERVSAGLSIFISGVVVVLAVWALFAHARAKPEAHQTFTLVLIGCGTLLLIGLSVLQFVAMRRHTAQAWGGAGASVMLAGAAWVALVFTTAAVTSTANYLNGADHGVADLVSQLGDNKKSEVTDVVDLDGRTLAATGDVVIEDAIVTFRPDGQPMIHAGTVRSERLFNRDGPSGKAAPQKGRVEVESGTVVLDNDRIRFRDSCVIASGSVPKDDSIETFCTAESKDFAAGGTYLVPQASSTPEFKTTVPNRPPSLHLCGPKGHPVVVAPTFPPEVPIVVPQVLIWAPLAQSLWVVGIVVILIGALWRFRPALKAIDALAEAEVKGPHLRAARSARRSAAFAHKAERLIDVIGSLTAVLAIALIGFSALGEAPWVRHENLRPFATVGMTVALALGVGIVALAARIRNSEGVRKGVGILWDLSTFWPRSAHPLAPPCYAERVVPELVARVDWALDAKGGRAEQVVLSGHSQGSVIVCAVLSRYSSRDLARLRVITYGSQIRQLYGRVFPAVFGPDQIGYLPTPGEPVIATAFPDVPAVDQRMEGTQSPVPWSAYPYSLAYRLASAGDGGSWVNLFRRTDPIGFRVFSDADVEPDRYTSELAGRPGDLSAPIQGHGGMWHSPEYRTAVAQWTGEPVVGLATDTLDVPTLPT